MTVGLLFAGGARPLDYGRRLWRLRWRRAFPQAAAREAADALPAAAALAGVQAWIAVRDETALPLPGARVAPLAGRVALAASRGSFDPAAPHSLRELESAVFRPDPGADSGPAPAVAFRTDDFPPAAGEPLGAFLARLAAPPTPREVAPEFAVFAFDDPFERERPDVTRHVPLSARRLLDVGREGDALATLSRLAAAGERFDAFLFADVLEYLEDPAAALALARRLAVAGACLVASVPNVGHVSLVRDLALGRFDPVPAGLFDAGHLRWFTRRSLAEALEEAGWSVVTIEAEAGAPARDAQAFLARFEDWPGLDRESLLTYQWIAVARLDGAPAGTVDIWSGRSTRPEESREHSSAAGAEHATWLRS